jgi:Autotransporter beta-domain
MRITRTGAGFGGKIFATSICATLVLAMATPALAVVGGGSPPPKIGPKQPPKFGPEIPYISGRLGSAGQSLANPPVGSVLPDDFCLPGKFTNCGDHLRDQPDFSPSAPEQPVFSGNPDLAFAESKNSFWVNGQLRTTEQSLTFETRQRNAYSFGGDHRFGQKFILGAMVINSDSTLKFSSTGIEDAANGLLAGPYFAYDLAENWQIDGRIAAGNIAHTVNTLGVFTGEYKSFEGFAALRLSGKIERNNWRFHPSIEVATLIQNDEAYIDGVRGPIAAQNTTDTFVTASLLAYYDGLSLGQSALSPYVGLEASQPTTNGGSLFGTLRAGMAMTFGNGAILNLDYAYGAIGLANVSDQMVSLRVEIPF